MGSRLVLNLREAYYRPYPAAVPNTTLWGHSNWSGVGREGEIEEAVVVVERSEEGEEGTGEEGEGGGGGGGTMADRRKHHSKHPVGDVEVIELGPIPSPPGPSRCHEPLWMVVEEEGEDD
jgi:hypothetical protein